MSRYRSEQSDNDFLTDVFNFAVSGLRMPDLGRTKRSSPCPARRLFAMGDSATRAPVNS